MELITLAKRDLFRIQTSMRVLDGALAVADAAQILSLSTRQIKRLTRRLRTQGAAAFTSRRRRMPPNNAFDPAIRERVLELVRSDYAGFGPTFLAEKLAEHHQVIVNRETLRQWLIEAKLHRPRRRRQKPRPMRERRPRFGELLQADGSPHRWFEERGAPCTLLLCVDDATTMVLGGLFTNAETTDGYFELFEEVFGDYGLPLALYTDKHGIFRINYHGSTTDKETHVQRALRKLGVDLICANSPQAKGRVERINRTLQDRLVKELRIHGISAISEGNLFLPTFLASFNARFATQPRDPENAHRPSDKKSLARILTKNYERILTRNLTFQINDRIYAIDPSPLHRLRSGMRINVCVPRDGQLFVLYKNQQLPTRFLGARQRTADIADSKQLNARLDRRVPNPKKAHKPPKAHPWRAGYDPVQLAIIQAKKGHF